MYEQKKFVYEKAPAQRRLRQILVKLPHDADAKADKAAAAKADALAEKLKKGAKATGKDGADVRRAGEAVVGRRRDQGARRRSRLAGARRRPTSRARPRTRSSPPSPAPSSGRSRGNDGYVITKVEGAREGDIPFDKVKLELAEEKLRRGAGRRARRRRRPRRPWPRPSEPDRGAEDELSLAAEATTHAAAADAGPAPRVEETGLFALRATPEGAIIEGIGVSNADRQGRLRAHAGRTRWPARSTVGGSFFVVRLKERKEPDMAEFEKRKFGAGARSRAGEGERVLSDWTHAALRGGEGGEADPVNTDVLKYERRAQRADRYEPCVRRHRLFGG